MANKRFLRSLAAILLFTASAAVHAQLPWSGDTHQIAFGDFNGDGKTDLLYVARSPSGTSGVALSTGTGPYNSAQTWASNYLGIAWHSGTYEPIVADFNGDGKADILLQRQGQGDHYLLLANSSGQFTAINQTIPFNLGGQIWSADGHRIVAGDFNGDGKADLFLQSVIPSGLNAVFLASASGTFSSAQQTWGNDHIGFKWSLQNAVVQAGDFNGDGKVDLLVQAKPDFAVIDFDVTIVIPFYPPGRFGIANAKSPNVNGEIFFTPALQIWDRNYQGIDWSAANYNAIVGDFNGDGRADILLQGKVAGRLNSLFQSSASGQFTSTDALTDNTIRNATGDLYRIYATKFNGAPAAAGFYLQANTSGGTSSIASSAAPITLTYSYDALGRLSFVVDTQNGNRDYDYDKAGNRLLVSVGTTDDAAAEPSAGATTAITSSSGTILPAAASLYTVSSSCSGSPSVCTWLVRKLYGDLSPVVVVVQPPPNAAAPACASGSGVTQQITSGYVRSTCVLTAVSTTYGH